MKMKRIAIAIAVLAASAAYSTPSMAAATCNGEPWTFNGFLKGCAPREVPMDDHRNGQDVPEVTDEAETPDTGGEHEGGEHEGGEDTGGHGVAL